MNKDAGDMVHNELNLEQITKVPNYTYIGASPVK